MKTPENMREDVNTLIQALTGSTLPGAQALKSELDSACHEIDEKKLSLDSATNGLFDKRDVNPQQEREINAAFSSACRRAVMAHKTEVMQYKGLDKLKSMLNSFAHKYCGFELFKIKAKEIKADTKPELENAQRAVETFSNKMKR